MSIEEIKNIKKLQQILKSEIELREYIYKCCQEAGKELAKHSFAWDGKEKNLVIQAMELNERFEAKEQECERLKSTNKIYEQGIARLKDEKNNLKKENNSLKETIDGLISIQYKLADNCVKYSQTLTEIKPILEYYASSTLGEKTKDGKYRIELSCKYGTSNYLGAPCYYEYNPKPAREALRKINEVEDVENN